MLNINRKSDEIFQNLTKYIQSKYVKKQNEELSILKSVVDNQYPLVVFETNTNNVDSLSRDVYRLDQVRNLSFEISVFDLTRISRK